MRELFLSPIIADCSDQYVPRLLQFKDAVPQRSGVSLCLQPARIRCWRVRFHRSQAGKVTLLPAALPPETLLKISASPLTVVLREYRFVQAVQPARQDHSECLQELPARRRHAQALFPCVADKVPEP